MPDEGKLPVSWLAGNQGEYATSTEVKMVMMVMMIVMKMVMMVMMVMMMEKMANALDKVTLMTMLFISILFNSIGADASDGDE